MASDKADIAALKILVTHIIANLALMEGSPEKSEAYIAGTRKHLLHTMSVLKDANPQNQTAFIEEVAGSISQILSGYNFRTSAK